MVEYTFAQTGVILYSYSEIPELLEDYEIVYEKEPQKARVNAEIRAYTPAVQQTRSFGIDIGAVACLAAVCVLSFFCPPAAQTLQYQLGY